MHLLRTLILPTTLLCTVLAADPAPPIEVRARQLSITQSVVYEADGSVKSANISTGLDIELMPPAELIVFSLGRIEVTEWVCDDGTRLTASTSRPAGSSMLGPQFDAERRKALIRAGNPRRDLPRDSLLRRDEFSVHIGSTQVPSGTAIARLSGTVTLQVGDGAVQEAVIKPVQAMVGKPVALEGQPGLAIAVDAWSEDQIAVSIPVALAERLQGIELRGSDGQPIGSKSFNAVGDGERMVRTMRVRVPADGAVAVRFVPRIKELVVPFTLTNLALPSSAAPGKSVGKVPVEQPKAEGAPATEAGRGGF